MDTEESINFIEEVIELFMHPPWIFPLNSIDKLYRVKNLLAGLKHGQKFEKMYYLLKNKVYTNGGKGISKDVDELEHEFLGCKPKTRRQRINDILSDISNIGVAINVKELKSLLIELRDEEEDV